MYGSLTPKRHIAYCNSKKVSVLDLGTLLAEMRKALSSHQYQSSKTYQSKKGKKSFAGTRFLKRTQTLGYGWWVPWCSISLEGLATAISDKTINNLSTM